MTHCLIHKSDVETVTVPLRTGETGLLELVRYPNFNVRNVQPTFLTHSTTGIFRRHLILCNIYTCTYSFLGEGETEGEEGVEIVTE